MMPNTHRVCSIYKGNLKTFLNIVKALAQGKIVCLMRIGLIYNTRICTHFKLIKYFLLLIHFIPIDDILTKFIIFLFYYVILK